MYKYQILFLLLIVQLIRLTARGKNINKIILNFFIVSIPFEFTWALYEIKYTSSAGTVGSVLNLTIPILLIGVLLFKTGFKFKVKFLRWFLVIGVLFAISLINPFNDTKFATIVFGVFLLSHYLFLSYIGDLLTREEILGEVFDGLAVLCIIQIICSICFPVLEIKQVTTLFHEVAGEWSTRMDTRIGAVGTFKHPGNLALFITIVSTFFLSCYLIDYRRKVSFLLLVINALTLVLTYSRTSYLAYVIDMFIVFVVIRNAHKKLLSIKTILKYSIPIAGSLIYLIYYSPLSDSFLKSDADEMLDARLVHLYMGVETFLISPFVGVGLNTHLEYMCHHTNIFGGINFSDFFLENPIHNIHLIVLTETGVLGFIVWLVFIIKNISASKQEINVGDKQSGILSSAQIGAIIAISIYGLTGWAPFSPGILPFVLLICFFAMHMRHSITKVQPSNNQTA